MKIKIRSDAASALREDGWSQMGDPLASLCDDSRAEPLRPISSASQRIERKSASPSVRWSRMPPELAALAATARPAMR